MTAAAPTRRTVRNAVRKLRRKLGDDARDPKYILSERGLGYRMPGARRTVRRRSGGCGASVSPAAFGSSSPAAST